MKRPKRFRVLGVPDVLSGTWPYGGSFPKTKAKVIAAKANKANPTSRYRYSARKTTYAGKYAVIGFPKSYLRRKGRKR
jgi:hypothetical protein